MFLYPIQSLIFGYHLIIPIIDNRNHWQNFNHTNGAVQIGSVRWTQTKADKMKQLESKSFRDKLISLAVFLILTAGAILFAIPFIWMLSTSLKPLEDVWSLPVRWIPQNIVWSNYIEALTVMPFLRYTFNTLVITVSSIVGTIFSASLVAYGFSRLNFRGRDTIFFIFLLTMMIPAPVLIVPLFAVVRTLGWLDTYWGLIVPYPYLSTAFGTFLLRQFFMTVPRSLDDAARLDGCSDWRIYWHIILPILLFFSWYLYKTAPKIGIHTPARIYEHLNGLLTISFTYLVFTVFHLGLFNKVLCFKLLLTGIFFYQLVHSIGYFLNRYRFWHFLHLLI